MVHMAFYAIVKKILRYKVSGYVDQIAEYKKYLHKQWLDSLTEEDRSRYLEKEKRSHDNAVAALSLMCAFNIAHGGNYW